MTPKIGSAQDFLQVLFTPHSYTSATYWHYGHRRRYIIQCLLSVFNWNICLCRCQNYQWTFRWVMRVSAYPVSFGFVSQFEHMQVVTWSNSKLIHNCTGMNFQWASSFTRFLDHIRHITVGRTLLDEWSARRRDLYLTTHKTYNRQTSIPPVGFKPTISAHERPQIYALNRAAIGIGIRNIYIYIYLFI